MFSQSFFGLLCRQTILDVAVEPFQELVNAHLVNIDFKLLLEFIEILLVLLLS